MGLLDREFRFQPVTRLTLPEWCDQFRRLPAANSAVPGPWRTSRVEAARGPMMAFTEPGVRTITVCSCTQLLKSELLLGVIGYSAHVEPCPILLCQPNHHAAENFSRERVAKMIRETPVLRDRFDWREKSGEDKLSYKEFPGGFLAIESAGSPTNLAMRAVRITLLDEIDKYLPTKEGDPVALAEERTSTFGVNAKRVRVCSPTHTETSRIWQSYQESDQRRAYIACPHCNDEMTLHFFKHVQWEKSETEHFPATAAIYCEHCGAAWSEDQRRKAITTQGAIRWKQTRPFVCCGIEQEPMKTRKWAWDDQHQVGYALCTECNGRALPNHHAGYQASKILSPFITIVELAEKWIVAKDHPDTKLTFRNTQLGEAAEVDIVANKVEPHILSTRRENFVDVPGGVLRLTAGVDVQSGSDVREGRIECHVMGWGPGEEAWSVAYRVFHGDVTRRDVWNQLDEFLLSRLPYERGGAMAISAACIDSSDGNTTQLVYDFAKARVGRRIWAIKGNSDRGSGSWGPIWPVAKARRSRDSGFKPIMIGVNTAKQTVMNCLAIDEPGPAYIHFPMDRTNEWFEQLTAEHKRTESKGGFRSVRWVLPRGRANEALDTTVYALAALHGLYARGLNLEKAAAQIEAYVAASASDAGPLKPPIVERPTWAQSFAGASHGTRVPSSQRVRRSRWME